MLAFSRIMCRRCQYSTINKSSSMSPYRECRLFATTNIVFQNSSVNCNIVYPLGNKSFTRYLEIIQKEYTDIENNYTDIDRASLKRKELFAKILAIYNNRQSIVGNLKALNDELANETNSEMLSMGREEIMVRLPSI